MSTTTQILFNSPALHSLKREQLVKLCKIHSIKASGKNTDLIERLKQRAQELPKDGSLTMGGDLAPDEDDDDPMLTVQMPRPSEQWEVVMEDIEEEGSNMGTMTSRTNLSTINGRPGEFGTGGSKASSVSSSIKALATSLGIKRAASTKSTVKSSKSVTSYLSASRIEEPDAGDLTENAIPYSDLPPSTSLPRTDRFTLSTPDLTALRDTDADDPDGSVSLSEPVPGTAARPGVPAPANARLSMGTGLTTTIRLITTTNTVDTPATPRLQPLQTTFDIQMGTPGVDHSPGHRVNIWPASPEKDGDRLYPTIPFDDFPPWPAQFKKNEMPGGLAASSTVVPQATPAKAKASQPAVAATPGPSHSADVFSPAAPPAEPGSAARAAIPRSAPFLFGSPLPQHNISNKTFGQAAASVLEEMNRRLAETGAQQVDKKVVEGKGLGESIFGSLARQSTAIDSAHQRTGSTDRFAKVHEQTFNKMDSIATHYAARRGAPTTDNTARQPTAKKRKSDVLGVGPRPGAKRKSSAAGARVISTGVRKKMGIPGGFGDDDIDMSEDSNVEEHEDPGDRRSSKRMRVADSEDVHKGRRVSIAPPKVDEDEEDERKKQREKEAIRRKLEANKARRRSSRGRVSVGTKTLPAKGKTSRFGFLSSAKSLVRNVWNMGAGSKTVAAPPSNIPVPKPSAIAKPAPKPILTAPPIHKPFITGANAVEQCTSTLSGTSSAGTTSNKFLKPVAPTAAPTHTDKGTVNSTKSTAARTRSPIPSFGTATRATSSTTTSRPASLIGTSAPRASASSGTAVARNNSRISTTGASSLGTKNSLASASSSGAAASSFGSRRSLFTTAQGGSTSSKRILNGSQDPADSSTISRSRTSSLLAPTASSLAKMRPAAGRASGLPAVAEQRPRTNIAPRKSMVSKAALDLIVNNPEPPRTVPGTIFSQPLTSPSLIPTPARNPSLTFAATAMMGSPSSIPKAAVPPKPKTLIARKPRISRSRVIAKLGAQRAATQSSATATSATASSGRVRSSMGARRSFGAVKAGGGSTAGADLLRSAKKRARQSEYVRRKSRATAGAGGSTDMDVDE
ncbi:hypothetical protein SCP_1702190 [Sparassis crispa]|uniref:SAP domain-containing protein n=1 Tax=Sparassis crispa TaxID=139825 RepID=A0A401H678_9APHY|nr:hypothetical protein SCP_1702190 [Sparassis crispa]GBE89893.1 hypothetical protein SCP_1702190 [Sparassis crispa]